MPGKRATPHTDRVLAELARRQHGVVCRRQLLPMLGRAPIEERLASGHLIAVHRGVYAVGHVALSREGRWMAAVLCAGPGAVLSHVAAGALWNLRASRAAAIDVTVPGTGGRRRRARIRVHRSGTLTPEHATTRHGIPVTTPARTLRDLKGVLTPHAYQRALRQAEIQQLHVPGLDAADRVRASVATASELEAILCELLDRAGLPRPTFNVPVGRHILDARWEDRRVVVELDGWETHRTRNAFEADRRRDQELVAAGWRVLRFTWRQLVDEPDRVIAILATVLGA